jgi:hypothetical protein
MIDNHVIFVIFGARGWNILLPASCENSVEATLKSTEEFLASSAEELLGTRPEDLAEAADRSEA